MSDLQIPPKKIERDLDAGKLDAEFGRWLLSSRTGAQALETLQQALNATVTIESARQVAPGMFTLRYKPGIFGTLRAYDMGRIMRNVPAERAAFIVAYQAEELEHALAERENMEETESTEAGECAACIHSEESAVSRREYLCHRPVTGPAYVEATGSCEHYAARSDVDWKQRADAAEKRIQEMEVELKGGTP